MKTKLIVVISIIAIIIVALYRLPPLEEKKASEAPPIDNNTIYVQSSLPGECRAIITPILDSVESVSSEIPCKVQLRSKK